MLILHQQVRQHPYSLHINTLGDLEKKNILKTLFLIKQNPYKTENIA